MNFFKNFTRQSLYPQGLLLVIAVLVCNVNAQAQSRYTYSAAGDEVTDIKTGLIWRRCSEGQIWNGSICSGTVTTFTHEQALIQAKAQSGNAGWRLPNVKELSSIVSTTRTNPSIDVTAFPTTMSNIYWTSTPHVGDSCCSWNVDFRNGDVRHDYHRFGALLVRLVR